MRAYLYDAEGVDRESKLDELDLGHLGVNRISGLT